MRPEWLKQTVAGLAFLSLLMLSSSLEAGHGPTRPWNEWPKTPALLQSSGSGVHPAAAGVCTVDPSRELLITDVSVVDDCYRTTWKGSCPDRIAPATRGAWTFGRIAEGIFGTNDDEKLSKRVRQWLNLWMETQTVNTEPLYPRTAMRDLVIRPWKRASGGDILDMKKAPFRLLAVSVRMDIGQPIFLPNLQSAGELRLVFGILDEHGGPTPFTMILEYNLAAHSCQEILGFVQSFHVLSSIPFGPAYNAALQTITDQIITRNAAPDRLNGSALAALRTNEAYLDIPWELRNFQLEKVTDEIETLNGNGNKNAKLMPMVVGPIERLQGTQTLADAINLLTPDFIDGNLGFPITFRGQPFLGGSAHNNLDLGWDGPSPACSKITVPLGRTRFSGFTCQGCHGIETGTNFLHITPRAAGQASQISQYFTGIQVHDICGVSQTFNDLERRRNFQCFLLTLSCPSQ